jgi:transposase
MSTRRYKTGQSRAQNMLLPASVEDYVTQTNAVRAIDAYVEGLSLEAQGFKNTRGGVKAGQPAYQPGALLKLYLYGYLNRTRSSRKLEQECQRNLEVIWLMQGLRPGYKTIADFRKENSEPLQKANKDFVLLCKELGLYGGKLVGIDGAFFEGNASKGSIYTENRLEKRLEQIEKDISAYHDELELADMENSEVVMEDTKLKEKLKKLKEKQADYQAKLKKLQESGEGQLSLTDEDARLLSKRGESTAGYNVQIAVDEQHKLLVCCEVTQDGNDLQQLAPMAKQAKEVLGVKAIEVAADGGYYQQSGLKECEGAEITAYVAIPRHTTPTIDDGRLAKEAFVYHETHDVYVCPAGQFLESCRSKKRRDGSIEIGYASNARKCEKCELKEQCLPKKTPYRQIYRWEHQDVIERHRRRMMEKGREYMRKRSGLAEHPFGTLKRWCGWEHFLVRGLRKVRGEMNLLMLCYNFRRVLSILGIEKFREYCQRRESYA